MKKMCFLFLLVLFMFISCSAKPKEIKVNSIDEIITSIEKYKDNWNEKYDKNGEPIRTYVKYTGSFSINWDDFSILTEELDNASYCLRVSLDFSKCNMDNSPYKVLGTWEFDSLEALVEIALPEGLTTIRRALCDCKNLKAIYLPKSVELQSIAEDAFLRNPQLEKIVTAERSFTPEEWKLWRESFLPKRNIIKEITASSELDPESGKYSIENINNSYWTSWVEGSAGDGSGEKITITLKEPTTLEKICIKNGFGNIDYYWSNNRPKYITVTLDDDEKTATQHYLMDTPFEQVINIDRLDKLYSKITLTIDSVYKGTDGADDCAIDEINVNETSAYVWSPTVLKMLKALYISDVGKENVRDSQDGYIEVHINNPEDYEDYWFKPDSVFAGHLVSGYAPGTGAGGSVDYYRIVLNPSGKHFLFIWNHTTAGIFKIYPPDPQVYEWNGNSWKLQSKSKHNSALDEVFKTLTFIENRGYSYKFDVGQYDYDDVFITVYPNDYMDIPVELRFEYDNGVYLPYKKTAVTELAFGSPESLSALGNWKEQLADEFDYRVIQSYWFPAAYNHDASMVKFLEESGEQIKDKYEDEYNGLRPYDFTVLDAWEAGNNTEEVRAALYQVGADKNTTRYKEWFEK